MRRIVTGHTSDGKATIVSDTQVDAITSPVLSGYEFYRLWGADEAPTFPDDGSLPPYSTHFPPVGGFRFGTFTVPPESVEQPENVDFNVILEAIDEEKYPDRVELVKQVIADKGEDPNATVEVKGIGGWMILPLVGLVITACLIFYHLVTIVYPLFVQGTIFALFSSQSNVYNPQFGLLIIFESAGNIVLFWLSIIVLYLCYTQSKKFVLLLIAFYLIHILLSASGYMATGYFEVLKNMEDDAFKDLLRSIIAGSIWIPYLLMSVRVKNTFTN